MNKAALSVRATSASSSFHVPRSANSSIANFKSDTIEDQWN